MDFKCGRIAGGAKLAIGKEQTITVFVDHHLIGFKKNDKMVFRIHCH